MNINRKSWLIFKDLKKPKGGGMRFSEISVDCAQKEGRQEPKSFVYQAQQRRVTEILDRWFRGTAQRDTSPYIYFKVRTHDQECFILRSNPGLGEWSILVSRKY